MANRADGLSHYWFEVTETKRGGRTVGIEYRRLTLEEEQEAKREQAVRLAHSLGLLDPILPLIDNITKALVDFKNNIDIEQPSAPDPKEEARERSKADLSRKRRELRKNKGKR